MNSNLNSLKCYLWTRDVIYKDAWQLQTVFVIADSEAMARKIFLSRAGSELIEKHFKNLMELPASEFTGSVPIAVNTLLKRYTVEESENGKMSRMFKQTPGHIMLILGKNAKKKLPNINIGGLLNGINTK